TRGSSSPPPVLHGHSSLPPRKSDSIIPSAQVVLENPTPSKDPALPAPPALPVIAGFESSPPPSRAIPSSRGAPTPGVATDQDRWAIAGTLKKAALEGDEAIARELAKLPPIAKLAYQIADIYSVATTGFSGPLLYARGGGAVEELLLEFQNASKK